MEFDITNLDKKELLQVLYNFATPAGFGAVEYLVKNSNGMDVSVLPDDECETALLPFYELKSGNIRIFDYYNGKPLKIIFEKKKDGRIIAIADGYDSRNGKYRFLEALLSYIKIEDILVVNKKYAPFVMNDLPDELNKQEDREKKLKQILDELPKY